MHAKDNNLLCSLCPFQSHFVVASMISSIHPRLTHSELSKPTLPASSLSSELTSTCAVPQEIPIFIVYIRDPLPTLPVVVLLAKMSFLSLPVKLLSILKGPIHSFSFCILPFLTRSHPSTSTITRPCLHFIYLVLIPQYTELDKKSCVVHCEWHQFCFWVVVVFICFVFHKKLIPKDSMN